MCKVLPAHAKEEGAGRGGRAQFILKHPLPKKKLVGPLGQSGRFGVRKNSLLLPGIERKFLGYPVRSLVTVLFM